MLGLLGETANSVRVCSDVFALCSNSSVVTSPLVVLFRSRLVELNPKLLFTPKDADSWSRLIEDARDVRVLGLEMVTTPDDACSGLRASRFIVSCELTLGELGLVTLTTLELFVVGVEPLLMANCVVVACRDLPLT